MIVDYGDDNDVDGDDVSITSVCLAAKLATLRLGLQLLNKKVKNDD